MQTGPALREVRGELGIDAIWYIVMYGTSAAIVVLASDRLAAGGADRWCGSPPMRLMLRVMVPRLRARSRVDQRAALGN